MQQTKQTRRACAGGAAARRGDVARQAGAVVGPGTGVPRPGGAVSDGPDSAGRSDSGGAATSAAVLGQDSASKAAGSGGKAACRLVAQAHRPPSLVCRLVALPPSWSIRPGRLKAVRSTTGR